MATPTPTDRIKGKGTQLYRLNDGSELPDTWDASLFTRIADIKELTPPELSKDTNDETYLDDDFGYKDKSSGSKDPGTLSFTIAWKPGETIQQTLFQDFELDVKTWYAIVYRNTVVDYCFGEVTKLGKTITENETITRSVDITLSGAPDMAEDV